MRLRFLTGLAAAAAVAAAAFAAVLAVGDTAPDASLAMSDGTDVKLSAHEGKTVVLFFYGTWLRKAPAQSKKLDALRKTRLKQKLVVIGVARDGTRDDAKAFAADHGLGFAQAADPKGALYDRFAEKGLPWTVVLDGARTLRMSSGGYDEEAIDAVLTDLLGKNDADREKEEKERAEREKAEREKAGRDGGAPPK